MSYKRKEIVDALDSFLSSSEALTILDTLSSADMPYERTAAQMMGGYRAMTDLYNAMEVIRCDTKREIRNVAFAEPFRNFVVFCYRLRLQIAKGLKPSQDIMDTIRSTLVDVLDNFYPDTKQSKEL